MNKETTPLSEKAQWPLDCDHQEKVCSNEDIRQALKDEWKDIVNLCWGYFYEEPAFKPFMDRLKTIRKKRFGSLADEEPKTEVEE